MPCASKSRTSLFTEQLNLFAELPAYPAPALANPVRDRPGEPSADPAVALAQYPAVPSASLSAHASMIGQAGAALVDSVLLARGLPVMPAPEGRAWDRLVLTPAGAAVTMQVKTTTRPGRTGLYAWNISCGYRGSPRGRRPYARRAFQVLACVVLPESAVIFLPPGSPRVTMRPAEIAAARRDPIASLNRALAEIGVPTMEARQEEAALAMALASGDDLLPEP